MGGIDLEREDSLLAQCAQQDVATLHDFLGGDVAEHLARGGGTFAKKFAQLGLADHGEENEMAMGEAGDTFDHFGCRGGFGKIGEPDDEASAFLKSEQRFGGALVIGFEFFAFHLCESFKERADVARSAAGGKALLDAAAVGEHGDAIAGIESDLRERERGGRGVVEFAETADTGAQQAAGVEDDPDGLAALDAVHLTD